MGKGFLSTSSIHLGLTTRCNLKCPFCSRTEVKKSKIEHWVCPSSDKNTDLNFTEYKKFFDKLNIDILLLCGNWGDPIFYPDLFNLIEYMNTKDCIIKIHTNGSGHNINWWKDLAKILKKKDRLYFSIDGIESNFTKYRVNASWSKIVDHIKAVESVDNRPKLIWKYILFKYNEDTVHDAMNEAKKLKMNAFLFVPGRIPEGKEHWKSQYSVFDYGIPIHKQWSEKSFYAKIIP